MKSPTSRVGIIEPDGILNGSTTKERRPNTIRITGKKLAPYSTHHGLGAPAGRRLRAWKRSKNQSTPVAIGSRNRVRAKFMRYPSSAGHPGAAGGFDHLPSSVRSTARKAS